MHLRAAAILQGRDVSLGQICRPVASSLLTKTHGLRLWTVAAGQSSACSSLSLPQTRRYMSCPVLSFVYCSPLASTTPLFQESRDKLNTALTQLAGVESLLQPRQRGSAELDVRGSPGTRTRTRAAFRKGGWSYFPGALLTRTMDDPRPPPPETLAASWGVMRSICRCLLLLFKAVFAPCRKQCGCFTNDGCHRCSLVWLFQHLFHSHSPKCFIYSLRSCQS